MALVTAQQLADALHLPTDEVEGIEQSAAAANAMVGALLTDENHDGHPACREAALHVAVELFQARNSAGGTPIALDLSGAPARLSVWVTRRIQALIAGCLNVEGWVG